MNKEIEKLQWETPKLKSISTGETEKAEYSTELGSTGAPS